MVSRAALNNPQAKVVGINDPFLDSEHMAYMLTYDSVHGRFKAPQSEGQSTCRHGQAVDVYAPKRPEEIPWALSGSEYIVESSEVFTTLENAGVHSQGRGSQGRDHSAVGV